MAKGTPPKEIADHVASMCLRGWEGMVKVEQSKTTTGSCVVRLIFNDGDTYNLTITRARS